MNYNFNMSKIYMNKLEAKIKELEKQNNNLKEDFKRHIDRINELTNRIDKAIDYIENKTDKVKYKEIGITEKRLYLIHNQVDYLLDILKGSDSNEWR